MVRQLNIEVLGCHGGEMAGFLAPSLLIDDRILLDAGSFGTVMSLKQQLAIDHVLLSHAHCDHVKDLAGFADLIIGRRLAPVKVYASPGAMQILRGDLFNNRLWPDFFALPNSKNPVLKAVVFKPNRPFKVSHLKVLAIPVSHPVESMGFIIHGQTGSFVYTGDTGPTNELWRRVNRLRNLKMLMIETKFPNALDSVAEAAGHLTPLALAKELTKIRINNVPISLFHLKPDRIPELIEEIAAINNQHISIMQIGDRYRI
jgi:ribonuclease BN (tRNA processing enzyme)